MRTEGGSFQFSSDPDRLRQLSNRNVFLAGTSNPGLAEKVGRLLQLPVGHPIKKPFADGELNVHIDRNLRRRRVTIFQSTAAPKAPERILEVVLIADAARRGSAGEVTAIFPYYGYGRQDRKDRPRVPISAAVESTVLVSSGVDHFVTVDLHSAQTQSSVPNPWDDLPAKKVLIPQIMKIHTDNLVIVSPDLGGERRASRYAQILGSDYATISKGRNPEVKNKATQHGINGNVEGMDCVLVDDMIDTGGTLVSAAQLLIANGATSVAVAATHGVFSDGAVYRLHNSPISQIIITDTIHPSRRVGEAMHRSGKFRRVTVAPILAHAIYSNQTGDSLSDALF
ncbi:MAG: ribose-phosphate diphosphokinase [Microgenomates group bacterium]